MIKVLERSPAFMEESHFEIVNHTALGQELISYVLYLSNESEPYKI
jgi:hypothetical protein